MFHYYTLKPITVTVNELLRHAEAVCGQAGKHVHNIWLPSSVGCPVPVAPGIPSFMGYPA